MFLVFGLILLSFISLTRNFTLSKLPLHSASACIDRKNPKLAFYCRNQKFGSILEGGNHSQHFLKPKSALIFVLLLAVFTLFFQFLQFSIRKKNVFFNYGQGGSGPRLLLVKINQFHMRNQYFIEFSLGPEPPWT